VGDSRPQGWASASPEDLTRLREVLAQVLYTDRDIALKFGALEVPTPNMRNLSRLLRATSGRTPLDLAIRLFLLGQAVTEEEAASALDGEPPDRWVDAGVLERRGSSVTAALLLVPFRGFLLAFDNPIPVAGQIHADVVTGLNNSSIALLLFTIRREFRRALDVGTGGGIQALFASRHCEEVVATDLNPRALAVTRFNLLLNGVTNVRLVLADAAQPLQKSRFDLIVSNPPYMISPGRRYVFREGGLGRDEFCRRLVRDAAEKLVDGGYAQICCEWIHPAGEDWRNRLSAWFERTGCDAWVLHTTTADPAGYAERWIEDSEPAAGEHSGDLFNSYLDYYESERIEAIGSGLVALRKREGRANWIAIEDAPEWQSQEFGAEIELGFRLRDYLEEAGGPAGLLAGRFEASPDLVLEQTLQPRAGQWQPAAARLRLTRGLQFSGNVDGRVAEIVSRCDGVTPLAEVFRSLAASLGLEPGRITAGGLEVVRQLVRQGFLLPKGFIRSSPSDAP